jgi:hypothetical protein
MSSCCYAAFYLCIYVRAIDVFSRMYLFYLFPKLREEVFDSVVHVGDCKDGRSDQKVRCCSIDLLRPALSSHSPTYTDRRSPYN